MLLTEIVYSPNFDAAIKDLSDWFHDDGDDWMRERLPKFIKALEDLLPALRAVSGGLTSDRVRQFQGRRGSALRAITRTPFCAARVSRVCQGFTHTIAF